VSETGDNSDPQDSVAKPLAGLRILHVTLDGPAHNPRMLKENRTYLDAGARVAALIVGQRRDDDLHDDNDGAALIAYRLPRWRSLRAKIASQALFRSRDFRGHIERAIREWSPDVIQAHDMFVAGSALAARPRTPVVLDLHEHYPAAVEVYRTAYPPLKRLLFALFQHRRRMERIERRFINRSTLTLTVTEEATERIIGKCPRAITTTVPNVERRDFGAGITASSPSWEEGVFRLTYVGSFENHRGLDTLVRAIARIDNPSLRVELIGARDSDYVRWLRREIDRLEVGDAVVMHEWIPSDAVSRAIDTSDLALVPHAPNDQTNATLPHKLFQYMARSKPVLVSSCPPLAKHVHAADSGFVFRAGDEHDCARVIREALDRRADLTRLGENGRRYVTETMNWELVSGPALIRAVLELTEVSPKGPGKSTSSLGSCSAGEVRAPGRV
jgi:glycosyltransferase involved in cell wall biosynthesis